MSNLRVSGFINKILGRSSQLSFPGTRSKLRLGPRGRLLTAAAISFTLHGGAVAIDSLIRYLSTLPQSVMTTAEKPVESAETETEQISEAEKIILLEKFKAEKKEFIQQLLQDLHQAKRIPISDFAIKSEILDRNIENLESESGDIASEKKMRKRYKTILRHAKKWTGKFKWRRKKIEELHHFSHYRMFRGYLKGSSEVIGVLKDGIYNCKSSTEFQTALEDDIVGSNNFGVVVLDPLKDTSKGKSGGHLLSWYREGDKLWQIENTNGAPPRRVPFEKGLRTPKEIFIAAYLINNGIKVSQLPKRIRRFYKRGVGVGGFPVAGVSTDLPDPPDYLIPNPYFGIKNPKPIEGCRCTKDFYDWLKSPRRKSVETAQIIKDARINAMALSLFQEPDKEPGPISFSLVKIPQGVDWCKVAEETIDLPDSLGGSYWLFSLGDELYPYPNATFSLIRIFRYLTAIRMAKILSDVGDKRFESCIPEAEYGKFVEDMAKLDEDDDLKESRGRRLLRGLSDPKKARKELFKIINRFGVTWGIGVEALELLAIIASPSDLDFFRKKLFEDVEGDYELSKQMSSYGLLHMKYEAKEVSKIFTSAIENEGNIALRGLIMAQIGKLGYGIKALRMMEKDLLPRLDFTNPETDGPLGQKRWITANISNLHPDIVTNKDIQTLRNMIEKEGDLFTKVNLIAILAKEGKIDEALKYVKRLNLSELEDYHDRYGWLKGLVFSLAKIYSPEIKEILISILDAHPDLATVVGGAFVRQGFRSENIVRELKRILNNELIDILDRHYAALLLIQMGAL